jgi:hypothetical protein
MMFTDYTDPGSREEFLQPGFTDVAGFPHTASAPWQALPGRSAAIPIARIGVGWNRPVVRLNFRGRSQEGSIRWRTANTRQIQPQL